MTKALRDPNLPALEIVEERDDGSALRNDGVEFRSRLTNPWYVLATLHGEQGAQIDEDLAARNRRAWSLWSCQALDPEARAELAGQIGLDEDELGGAWEDERREIERLFQGRLGAGAVLPSPDDTVNMEKLYFAKGTGVSFVKYVFVARAHFADVHFAEHADFSSAHFAEEAVFSSSHFAEDARFQSAHFDEAAVFYSARFVQDALFHLAHVAERAVFSSAHFAELADFSSAHFADAIFRSTHFASVASFHSAYFAATADFASSYFAATANFSFCRFSAADFSSVRFANTANFSSVHFAANANFSSVYFAERADFSSSTFKRATRFDDAVFLTRPPKFFAEVYQDTTFTLDDASWPEPSRETAAEDEGAYVRLKQLMVDAHKPDHALFFLRREFRSKLFTERRSERVWIWIFWRTSDFGYSIWRPIIGLVALIVVGWLAYLTVFAWDSVYGGQRTGFEAFGLSFSNTFAFLGLNRVYFEAGYFHDLPTWIKVAGVIQTFLGIAFLFFLGLGLRNRFRLK